MKKHLTITLTLVLLLARSLVFAQGAITTAVPFLTVAPDARGSGLANCGAASKADVFSMYYNPAKYAFIDKNTSIGVAYGRGLLGQTDLFHGAVAQRIGQRSVIAASFRYHDEMSVSYVDPLGFAVSSFTPHHFAADLAYAFQLNDALSIAVAGRYIRSYAFSTSNPLYDTKTGQSFAGDLGVYYCKPLELWHLPMQYTLGASITNLGSKISYGKDNAGGNQNGLIKTPIPTTLRIGTGLKANLNEDHSLTGMIDFTKLLVPSSMSIDSFKEELYEINYGLGLEYAWKDMVFVRAGYFNQPQLKGNRKYLAFGLGFEYGGFGIDASYHCSTTSINNTYCFCVDTHFGF